MNNMFPHYNAHMNSPISYPGSRRETEIEYIFRVAREKEAAEKAERRKAKIASLKAALTALLHKVRFVRTPSLHSQLGH
jgi:hypothetical protein